MKNEDVYQVDDESFITAIKTSKNTHEALKKMGLNARGAAYQTFKRRCKTLHADLSHFVKEKDLRKLLSIEEIKEACTQSISRQETLKRLKLNPQTGVNVSWIQKQILSFNIDTTHWLGKAHLTGRKNPWVIGRPLSEILVQNSDYMNSSTLKKRLVDAALLEYKCNRCGISNWLGEKLSLQLEHKNGDHTDNRIDNLCLLCPNCHSLTPTFAGRNTRKSK
jgi:hypothetical protein